MIEVSVTLISAADGKRTQLALMHLINDGTTSTQMRGNYDAIAYRGRGAQLEKRNVIKKGRVPSWPREAYHVWNLVRAALTDLGYVQGQLNCQACRVEQKNKPGYPVQVQAIDD